MLQLQNILFIKQQIDRKEWLPILTGRSCIHNNSYAIIGRELYIHKRPDRYKDLC